MGFLNRFYCKVPEPLKGLQSGIGRWMGGLYENYII